MGFLDELAKLLSDDEPTKKKKKKKKWKLDGALYFQNIRNPIEAIENDIYKDVDDLSRYTDIINVHPSQLTEDEKNRAMNLLHDSLLVYGFSCSTSDFNNLIFVPYDELHESVRFFQIIGAWGFMFMRIPNGNNFRVIEFTTGLSYNDFRIWYNSKVNGAFHLPDKLKFAEVNPISLSLRIQPAIGFTNNMTGEYEDLLKTRQEVKEEKEKENGKEKENEERN